MTTMDSRYSIGIPEMDAQHARLFELIDRFRAKAADGLADDPAIAAAEDALAEMLDYVKQHFSSEEAFMERHGFPGLAAHKRKHRELEDQVNGLHKDIQDYRAGAKASRSAPLKLNLFVNVWLLEHILGEDGKYASYVLAR